MFNSKNTDKKVAIAIKVVIHLLFIGYFAFIFISATQSPDPGKFLVLHTGELAVYALLVCLAMTPLKNIFGQSFFIKFRRLLGLYGFTFCVVHLLMYFWQYLGFNFVELGSEIAKRPYIIAGMLAVMTLLPLAITSTKKALRKLGGKKWKRLHKLVFVSFVLVLVHVWWQVRSSFELASIFTIVFTVLMILRLPVIVRRLSRLRL